MHPGIETKVRDKTADIPTAIRVAVVNAYECSLMIAGTLENEHWSYISVLFRFGCSSTNRADGFCLVAKVALALCVVCAFVGNASGSNKVAIGEVWGSHRGWNMNMTASFVIPKFRMCFLKKDL